MMTVRAGVVQPGKGKAPGRPQSSLPVPGGGLQNSRALPLTARTSAKTLPLPNRRPVGQIFQGRCEVIFLIICFYSAIL